MKSVTQVKIQSSDPLIFESKMVLFTCEPNFRGATETHHAGLQKETFLLTVQNLYILILSKEFVFCFLSYSFTYLATFCCYN